MRSFEGPAAAPRDAFDILENDDRFCGVAAEGELLRERFRFDCEC